MVRRTKLRPVEPATADRYCRLFNASPAIVDYEFSEKLKQLANSMKLDSKKPTPIPLSLRIDNPPPAGYTYFGQFIDHDLTEDRTPFRAAGILQPWQTRNRRSPWLDLSGVYSYKGGVDIIRQLFADDGISFRLGEPTLPNGEQFDLRTDTVSDLCILGDSRNNENIILRQIQVMFLKLHNLAVAEIIAEARNLTQGQVFALARDRVQWQYQYLVRSDFLKLVCKREVYEDVLANGCTHIDWETDEFAMPVELAQAVLRFGHSMVRAEYFLNADRPGAAKLEELLCEDQARRLTNMDAVEWNAFSLPTGELAMALDAGIVEPLYAVPNPTIHLYVDSPTPHPPIQLPVRTLLRGAMSKVASAQQVTKAMNIPPISPTSQIVNGARYDPGAILRELSLDCDNTPLWYYILLEAEVEERGARLGTLGSRLLAETVEGSLWNDRSSYLHIFGRNWQPPPWKRTGRHVTNLNELAVLVGLAPET